MCSAPGGRPCQVSVPVRIPVGRAPAAASSSATVRPSSTRTIALDGAALPTRRVPASGSGERRTCTVALAMPPRRAKRQSHAVAADESRRPGGEARKNQVPPMSSVLWMAYVISHSAVALARRIAARAAGRRTLPTSILPPLRLGDQPLHLVQVAGSDLLL